MAMWDIPSIESAGVSLVRDTKVSHREDFSITKKRIHTFPRGSVHHYMPKCVNLFISLKSIMDLDFPSLSVSVPVAPHSTLQVPPKWQGKLFRVFFGYVCVCNIYEHYIYIYIYIHIYIEISDGNSDENQQKYISIAAFQNLSSVCWHWWKALNSLRAKYIYCLFPSEIST